MSIEVRFIGYVACVAFEREEIHCVKSQLKVRFIDNVTLESDCGIIVNGM